MRWNVGAKIGTGYGAALVIMVAVGVLTFQSIDKLMTTSQWVTHSHQVLQELDETLSGMQDAETGQRGYLLTADDQYLEPFRRAQVEVQGHLEQLRTLTRDNPSQQRRLDLLEPMIAGRDGKFAELNETIALRKGPGHGLEAALQVVRTGRGKQIMDDIRKVVASMAGEEQELLRTRALEARAGSRQALLAILLGTLVAAAYMALAGFFITRDIAGPLKGISDAAERIAAGDLDVAITATGRSDEVGTLSRTFARMTESLKSMAHLAGRIAEGDLRGRNQPQSERDVLGNAFAAMVDNLRRLTADLAQGIGVLGASAAEIVATSTQLVASSSESAAAVTETTTTVEEVRQTAQVSSDKARLVSDGAQKAALNAQNGRQSAEDVAAGMERIRQQMEAIATSMMRLSEHSQTIGQILATVEDLAVQSNLLAVNAAIEAAKAGEYGKGFGVVAQEVKSLAEQSRQATTQVRTLLGDIQKATTGAVIATEQGSKAVAAGSQQTEQAADAIRALAVSVKEAAQAATQIAVSSQQQLVGVDQVAEAMSNIKAASTQNVTSARQLETAARTLDSLGQRLKDIVGRYNV